MIGAVVLFATTDTVEIIGVKLVVVVLTHVTLIAFLIITATDVMNVQTTKDVEM